MTNIHTLIPDVYSLVQTKGWFTDELRDSFGKEVGLRMQEKFNRPEGPSRLRLSQMGPRCPCALWYSIHHPELAEPLPPWAEIKYTYGHLIEALAIALAKAAGHTVEGEQDELSVDGITGHRDCVIDGCVVDVKSAGSYLIEKFKTKTIAQSDDFGYLDQLDGYLVGSLDDPIVKVKDKAYDWAVDKQLGHMVLYEHTLRERSIRARIAQYKETVGKSSPPTCECGTVPDGKSGNIKLNTKASYNVFKHCCFPNLRTFLYASGPVYLTRVVRKPDVTEISKDGKVVYSPM